MDFIGWFVHTFCMCCLAGWNTQRVKDLPSKLLHWVCHQRAVAVKYLNWNGLQLHFNLLWDGFTYPPGQHFSDMPEDSLHKLRILKGKIQLHLPSRLGYLFRILQNLLVSELVLLLVVGQDGADEPRPRQADRAQVMTNIGYPASDLFHLFHCLHDMHSADRTETTLVPLYTLQTSNTLALS